MDVLAAGTLFGVRDKVVLVTGGARGIGLMVRHHSARARRSRLCGVSMPGARADARAADRAAQIASGFVANGARVYISSRSADACNAVAAKLTAAGPGSCHALPEDLSTLAACERLAARLAEREPALHGVLPRRRSHHARISAGVRLTQSGVPPTAAVLVNNSGIAWGEPLEKHSEKGFDRVYALNVKAIFFLTRALLPLLDKGSTPRDPSRVINIGSIAGLRPQAYPTFSYDLSKAAVHHLTRKLADEFATRPGGTSITVNAIAPGYVPSKMSAQLDAYTGDAAKVAASVPLRRLGEATDMVGASLFLASNAGAWITGIVLPVDGGFLAKL